MMKQPEKQHVVEKVSASRLSCWKKKPAPEIREKKETQFMLLVARQAHLSPSRKKQKRDRLVARQAHLILLVERQAHLVNRASALSRTKLD